jgi:hypothetical protein
MRISRRLHALTDPPGRDPRPNPTLDAA